MHTKVTSIEKFFEKLPRLAEKMSGELFYRGQCDVSYKLTPSVFRPPLLGKESDIYLNIMTECAHEFETSMSHNEILSKMQHYGVPTRLLDLTSNPLVALYFACDGTEQNIDGVVYVIKANKNDIKQFDSDVITILSCLPRFTMDEQQQMKQLAIDFQNKPSSGNKDDDIADFNNKNKLIRRLLHEIKKEKPAFENIINPDDLLKNRFFMPKKSNTRIIRQSGLFIVFGLGDSVIDSDYSIIIDKSEKQNIINQLMCFGISKATLHPELYKVAEYIKEKYNN